jgi:hypothetical protein
VVSTRQGNRSIDSEILKKEEDTRTSRASRATNLRLHSDSAERRL